ncbi:conserved hypothetical protein [Ricinus communis]|uniref:Uncharacterized protein n=1 Tax=Ricinus communis TaxID=3988 RepID=B9S2C8_RICCO|nr:conserved hypothetical protein [Ricinus communis]
MITSNNNNKENRIAAREEELETEARQPVGCADDLNFHICYSRYLYTTYFKPDPEELRNQRRKRHASPDRAHTSENFDAWKGPTD